MEYKHKRIGVLMGGMSAEREVSLSTGEAIYGALHDKGYDVHKVFVDRDVDLVIRQNGIEVAFIALHGRFGEDGCVQGLLEIMGIPYTGSSVLSSALAMNKPKAKEILRYHNLPTPPYYVIAHGETDRLERIHGTFGFPCVVKPVSEGSSVGITIARDFMELDAACEDAFRFDHELMVERYIDGKEVTVAVLGDEPLGALEIVPKRGFYDYRAKYTPGASEYHCPARLSAGRYQGVLTHGLSAHRALGCSGVTRVDMLVSEDGNEFILEVNTLPGMTPTSLIPKIAHSRGIEFGDLTEAILNEARLHAGMVGDPEADRRVRQIPYEGPERRSTGFARAH